MSHTMIHLLFRSGYSDVKERVLKSGCYSAEENLRIYDKWFKNAPRYLFRAVDKKYGISKKTVCDVGCSYGMNLIHCAGGYGIEIDSYPVEFGRSLGLRMEKRDLVEDDLTDLPKVDVVWCSALLEHVLSPHIVLRKLHGLLSPNGLLCLFVPTISPFSFLARLPIIGKYFNGYTHGDHLNAFTPATLRFMCERAGFGTCELSSFYPGILGIFNSFSITDGVVYIGRKMEHWEYPENSTRKVSPNANGYLMK